jgi:hypothetical protein
MAIYLLSSFATVDRALLLGFHLCYMCGLSPKKITNRLRRVVEKITLKPIMPLLKVGKSLI